MTYDETYRDEYTPYRPGVVHNLDCQLLDRGARIQCTHKVMLQE